MKDNKIDIMCKKCGEMILLCRNQEGSADITPVISALRQLENGLRQLQYDLELLRKCTLDNPEFDWKSVPGFEPDKYYDRRA